PRLHIDIRDLFDRSLIGEVHGLRNRTTEERLSRAHHTDVAHWGDETLALLAALVGAIKHRQVLFLEIRSAFDRHTTADHFVGFLDLLWREAQALQRSIASQDMC